MKKLIVIIAVLLLYSTISFAQPEPPRPPKGGERRMHPEKMLMDLKTKLDLNNKQFNEIKTLLFEAEKKLIDLRSEEVDHKEEMMEKHKSIMDATSEKISELLNDDQLKIFENIKHEREVMPPPPPKHGKEQQVPPPPPPKN